MTQTAAPPTIRTFADSSNTFVMQIKGRCLSARLLGTSQRPGDELRWRKSSADGSGKCDAISVGSHHAMFGGVDELHANGKAAVDQAEGLGQEYDQKNMKVFLNGDGVTVSMYFASTTDSALKPYTWYKAMVIAGAKKHDLLAPYIASLEAIDASENPDRTGHKRHMCIVTAVGVVE